MKPNRQIKRTIITTIINEKTGRFDRFRDNTIASRKTSAKCVAVTNNRSSEGILSRKEQNTPNLLHLPGNGPIDLPGATEFICIEHAIPAMKKSNYRAICRLGNRARAPERDVLRGIGQ